ncbi:ABC transporter [Pseudomonas sp. ANT_H14]|uniref:Gldg family protein n=1 Tax=unclassified Pseudomonas TaxID=196821 RepID=UPI0011EFD04F|nr:MULTISPECIES: Gldg family protein [unclassified Pseudomonas]KAA0943272.1 ABC transporter [Pseudomonas sp. ANT_H4]KAA0949843.1 ABC transporter [Pseudomonas sp. ANT_H14]
MRNAINFSVTIIVIPLLFLAFNLVWALKLPNLRLDFSEQKIHSLSDATNTLLTSLESPMDLYFFNSSKHPQKSEALKNHGQRVAILLREYERVANGKINLHLIDPAPFSEDEYKAGLFGLDSTRGFFGLIGTSADHGTQRIDFFNPEQEAFLEYEISHLIHKVAHPEQPVIGLISGLPMDGSRDERGKATAQPWQLLQEIRRQFKLMSLGQETRHIPEHVNTLMLVQPSRLPEQTLFAIDQFVLGGGKLMMFIDPSSDLDSNVETPALSSSLQGLLAAWGVQMPANKALADSLYATPAILVGGQLPVRHPAALTLPREALAQNDVSAWKLDNVTVLSSGALMPLKKSRTSFTPLLQSSGQAALFEIERFTVHGAFDSVLSEAAARGQRHVIAARIQGPAYSAFPDGFDGQKAQLQKAADIHVVVVADTDLLSDRVWASAQNSNGHQAPRSGNATFVLNTLDQLSSPGTLMEIRPRTGSREQLQLLGKLRRDAARSYQEKATILEQRLEQTEKEWQSLNNPLPSWGTQPVNTHSLLQALNKERLRLPRELHALKVEAYRKVNTLERNVKLLNIIALPLILSLIGLGIFMSRRRIQYPPSAAFY